MKTKYGKLFTLMIIYILTINISFAESTGVENGIDKSILEKYANNEQYLNNQLEELRRFNNSLLSTVHWSLGISVSIVVLLIGFSWYTNFKSFEEDKEKLIEDFNNLISKKVKLVKKELLTQIETVQKESTETIIKDVDKQFLHHKERIMLLMSDSITKNTFSWLEDGKYEEAIKSIAINLEFSTELHNNERINNSIDLLRDILKNDFSISSESVQMINDAIKHLPDDYETEKSSLISIIQQKR